MNRFFAILILICLGLALAGCGGSPSSTQKQNDTAAARSPTPITTPTPTETGASETSSPAEEIVIKTGIGEDGGEVTFQTGGTLVWDSEKMGGMPQPEGTALFMEADMTNIIGKNFAYSYSVTGLTKEVYQEYIKLAAEYFPRVLEETLSDKEGEFVASTEDLAQMLIVSYIEGSLSLIQFVD